MKLKLSLFGFAFLAVGFMAVSPVMADDEALREQADQLRQKIEALSTQSGLDQQVDEYLDENPVWQGAQGGSKWDDVTVVFRLTAVGAAFSLP